MTLDELAAERDRAQAEQRALRPELVFDGLYVNSARRPDTDLTPDEIQALNPLAALTGETRALGYRVSVRTGRYGLELWISPVLTGDDEQNEQPFYEAPAPDLIALAAAVVAERRL
jgi:hypothetical protein